MIKEQAQDSEGQITCSGENTEKYITFPYQQKKKLQEFAKNGEEITKPYLTN